MATLNWIGKNAVSNHHRTVPYHLLKADPALSVGQDGGLASGNLLVQGDNLLALKALLPYYGGKVKCIYIDPPYNTGNEGWIYNDNVNSPEMREWLGKAVGKEAEDLSRHDKWLCMMYPRLTLLREFLREDGAIFVSIDDNEIGNLKLLMDEVFGIRNFVVDMIWQKMDSPSSNAKDRAFSNYHDHTLVYARSMDSCSLRQLPKPEILDAYPEVAEDGRRFRTRQLRKNGKAARRTDRPKMWYAMQAPDGTDVWPVFPDPDPAKRWEGRWAIGKKKYEELRDAGKIEWKLREYGWVPYSVERAPLEPSIPNPSIVTDVGQNRQAKAMLNAMLGPDHGFETPKPVGLVRRILEIASARDSIIMDSFAGSGTTGHAVLDLNKADGGHRRFVLIELDPKIAQPITQRRLAVAVSGYGDPESDEYVEGLGSGFRYVTLGPTLFDEHGRFRCGDDKVTFAQLAAHVFFTQTGEPIPKPVNGKKSPLIGVFRGTAYYLLFNGVLGDKRPDSGNVLTRETMALLPKNPLANGDEGPKVVFGEANRLSESTCRKVGIEFKQIPYQVEVS